MWKKCPPGHQVMLLRPEVCSRHALYLQGIDNAEIVEAVHARRAPMVPVGATLRR